MEDIIENKAVVANDDNEKNKLNHVIFSSSHINFFFGAGVNGNAFPQMNKFTKTIDYLSKNLVTPSSNIESDINRLSEKKQNRVFKIFKDELNNFAKQINIENKSIKDIENLFISINRLILETENRTKTTKQINIYTTNYDCIVEDAINRLGFLCNVISSSNIYNRDKFFEMIGYDYGKKRYIPTYLVSKIHGDLESPILPSNRKYDESLQSKRFEILFKMKSQLSRANSILFVIGYSGNDKHINSLLKDCILFGLTIYWFRYNPNDELPEILRDKVKILDQPNENEKINMTEVCYRMVDKSWDK